jgi:exodeoxyribonuclease VII large subunit
MGDSTTDETGLLEDQDTLTVRELNEKIASTIGFANYLQDVVCRGEISNRGESKRVIFLDLDDANAEHTIQVTVYRHNYDQMDFDGVLETGDEIVITGDVDFHKASGQVQIRPTAIERIGEGAEQARIEALRADLEDRGWFDASKKQVIPKFPECVGVVTSRDGDARHDIQSGVHARNPGIDITLHHASVQGENAPEELATGIDVLDRGDDVDAIVVGRGGGSSRHLSAFGTEPVAEAIHRAETPVISAVGHKEDSTIACDVADLDVSTPTASATVFHDREEALDNYDDLRASVDAAHISLATDRMDALADGADTAYESLINNRVDALVDDVDSAYESLVRHRLDTLERRVEGAYRDHERDAAVSEAEQSVPTVYRAAIVGLILLVTALIIMFFVL